MTSPPQPVDRAVTEYMLKEFLQEQKRLAQAGMTVENLYRVVEELRLSHREIRRILEDRVIVDQTAKGMRLDRYGKEIRAIKRTLLDAGHVVHAGGGNGGSEGGSSSQAGYGFAAGTDDDPLEDSLIIRGEEIKKATELAHLHSQVESMREKLASQETEKRNSSVWWKQQRWLLFFGVVMAMFTAIFGGAVGLIVWYVTHKP